MTALERRPDESEIDFHKRIIYGKIVDKTLSDEDYRDLSVLAYGREYNGESCRKMMYGSRHTLELLAAETRGAIGDEALLRDTDAAILDLEKERRRLFDQRREHKKLITDMARFEYITDKLAESAGRMNEELPLLGETHYGVASDGGDEAVIVLSDWHYGLRCAGVWNEYNVDICKDRLRRFAALAAERMERHEISKLHVLILGDLAHGGIRNSVRVASEELVCDQLMHVSEMVAELISFLADRANHTYIYSTYGNHMRTIQHKDDSIHADNMEKIIPWWLEQRLGGRGDCTVVRGDCHEFIRLRVKGRGVVAIHGDLDSCRTSGDQINTIFSKRFGETVDYIIYGDKHHIEEYESTGVENILVRGLCGTDDYANSKRLYSAPGQTLITFNDDGRDATYHINLS